MIIKHTLSFLNGLKSVLLVTFILSSPIFNASLVVAQEPDSDGSMKLEPIMVTSTRVLKDLSEVPLSISVIGEKEIEERPLPNTIDYLREMPGVQVSPVLESGGGFRSQYSYSLRGNGPDRTILLVDGVKQKMSATWVASESGQVNVDPSEIERIEVIKGPASVLYGSDAIGGVVNIITKKGGDKPVGVSAGVRYDGSNESLVPRVSIFGTHKGFSYRVSGSGFTSRDMILQNRQRLHHSEEHRENYNVKLGYEWDGGGFDFSASRYYGWQHLPSILNFRINPREQLSPNHVLAYGQVPNEWKNQLTGKLTLNDLSENLTRLTTTVYYIKQARKMESIYLTYNYATQLPTTVWPSIGEDKAHAIGGSVQADMKFGDHNLTVGIDAEKSHVDYYEVDSDARKGYRQEIAVFAQDEWKLSRTISMIYGLRYTRMKNALTYDKNMPEKATSISEKNIVGSLGFVFHGDNDLSARALVSQGFKAPSLSAQLIGATNRDIPNFDLRPEKSLNFELGVRYNGSPLLFDLSLFYTHLSEAFYKQETEIDYPRGGHYNQIQNSDEATSYGAELLAEYYFEDLGLTPYLSMTAMRYVRKYKNDYKTDNTGVPRTWGTAGLRWERHLADSLRLYTNASLSWSGGFHDEKEVGIDEETMFYRPGTRLDFVIGVEGGENHKYKAALNFRNIGDKRYEPYGYFQPGFHVVGTLDFEF